MIAVSLDGIAQESLMMVSVIRQIREGYIRAWFWLAGFTVIFSVVLALSFVLHAMEFIKIGSSWFDDALCVLADIVFYYIPFYMLGVRLVPVLTALLILGKSHA